MTTKSATNALFSSGFILIDGHVGHSLFEANLRLHYGVRASNSNATYLRVEYESDAFPHPGVPEGRLKMGKAVEGTYGECLEAWNAWVDNWSMAPEGQTICVRLGNSNGCIKPTSYRLGLHLSQCLSLSKLQTRTPRNRQLTTLLTRLIQQLAATQEEVVGVF